MSIAKVNSLQLGQSGTATNNFTVTAVAADGTMRLSRGNAGSTTQDIIVIDPNGQVDFPQGLSVMKGSGQQLLASGWQKLPGGLILQWGSANLSKVSNFLAQNTIAFPTSFPVAALHVSGSITTSASTNSGLTPGVRVHSLSKTAFVADVDNGNISGQGQIQNTVGIMWFALGY